jgi:hypothetical protein
MKLALIRKYILSIWREFFEPQERTIFDLIKNDGIPEASQNLIPSGFIFSSKNSSKNINN